MLTAACGCPQHGVPSIHRGSQPVWGESHSITGAGIKWGRGGGGGAEGGGKNSNDMLLNHVVWLQLIHSILFKLVLFVFLPEVFHSFSLSASLLRRGYHLFLHSLCTCSSPNRLCARTLCDHVHTDRAWFSMAGSNRCNPVFQWQAATAVILIFNGRQQQV